MNSTFLFFFLFATFHILLLFHTVQSQQPQYELAFTENESERTVDLTPGQFKYLRFVPDVYSDNTRHVSFSFEACNSRIMVYAISCQKASVTCDKGQARWYPNSTTDGATLYQTYHTDASGKFLGQPSIVPIFSSITTGDGGAKDASYGKAYFFGIVATNSVDDESDDEEIVQVRITFRRYSAERGGEYGAVRGSLSLETSPQNKLIKFGGLQRCETVENTRVMACTLWSDLSTGYTFYHVPMDQIAKHKFNLGTMCGVQRMISIMGSNATSMTVTPSTSFTFDKYENGKTYVLSVGYTSNQPLVTSDVMSEPVVWKRNSGGGGGGSDPVDPVDPGTGGKTDDGHRNTIVSIVIVMTLSISTVTMIILGLVVVLFWYRKKATHRKPHMYNRMRGNEPLHPYDSDYAAEMSANNSDEPPPYYMPRSLPQ